ncbi:MAG: DUF922 domain-containing protein [Mesorhizobium sp.]|nr:MAG: DUF922 domain-containing protein [Mesorhizobium sp.]
MDARTDWHAKTSYTWKVAGKTCNLTNVIVNLRLDVLLPRIKTGNTLSPVFRSNGIVLLPTL